MVKCPECDRVFDLSDETDADEWYHGHDCEAPTDKKKSNDRAFQTGWAVVKSKSRNQWCGVCNQKTKWVEQDPGEPGTEYECSSCGISDSTHTGHHRMNLEGGA
tara:strand:+ start:2253 stop:2564 length:312 start_codon:yes stop_codon:yes gene_type:complete